MSDDDKNPSDKALEAGENGDISRLPNFRGHGPKLSQESRAINPRAFLAAEHEGMSRDPYQREAGQQYQAIDPRVFASENNPQHRCQQLGQVAGDPYAATGPRPHSTLPRGMPRVLPPAMRPPAPPPPPPPPPVMEPLGITDAEAWDSYVLATLPVLMAQFPDQAASSIVPYAAAIADAMLEERRQRFE
jgi:hypothetical protein